MSGCVGISDHNRNWIRRAYWRGVSVDDIAVMRGRSVAYVESALFTRICSQVAA